jgi:hypothetical protein
MDGVITRTARLHAAARPQCDLFIAGLYDRKRADLLRLVVPGVTLLLLRAVGHWNRAVEPNQVLAAVIAEPKACNGVLFRMSTTLGKALFLALALLAVSAVLARPICDLDRPLGKAHHQDDCFASFTDATPAVPPDAAIPSAKPPVFLALTATWSPAWREAAWPAAAIPPDRPPLTRPYHARSARILT